VEKLAEYLYRTGISAVFIAGTTGECHSLTLAERRALADAWAVAAAGSPLRVIVHVGANCLEDARDLARQAQGLGAFAIAAAAPNYFKPGTPRVLADCCRVVADAAPDVPFYFYDIPSFSGVHISMPDFLDVAADRVPTLAGIKFSNPDLMSFQRCLRAGGGRFEILWGIDEYLLGALALGARGAVGSSYNFAAALYHRMVEAFGKSNFESAREEQYRSVRLIQILAEAGYMAAAKAVMGMLGVPVGPPRLPNTRLDSSREQALRDALEELASSAGSECGVRTAFCFPKRTCFDGIRRASLFVL